MGSRRRDALRSVLDCSILETFIRVADLGNISAAGRSLFVAQSAVSTQMTLLSRAAGIPLLERVQGRWNVTAAGAIFYRRAHEILDTVESLRRDLGDVSEVGHITLGSTRTISDTVLAPIVAGFRAAHPEIRLDVLAGNRDDAERRLASDLVDAALVALPIAGKGFEINVFGRDRLVLVVPSSHPLAHRTEASFLEFADEPFVVFETGSGVRALLEERLGERFGKLDIRLELTSNDALLQCVDAGLGLTLLPERVAQLWKRACQISTIVVSDVDLTRELALVVPENRLVASSVVAFKTWLLARDAAPPFVQ